MDFKFEFAKTLKDEFKHFIFDFLSEARVQHFMLRSDEFEFKHFMFDFSS